MAELADQLKLAYRTDTNYDDLWKQFAATKDQDPTQWYKHQLDFLGQQQGWQIGQNRSDRLAGLQPQIDNTIQQAKDAGLSEKEINSILGSSSQEGRNANVQRIATLADIGGTGFNFQKDLQPGLVMLAAATAAAMTGGAAAPALEGAEIGGAAAGSGAGDVFAGYSATGSAAGTAGSQLTASQIAALNATAAGGAAGTTGSTLGPDYFAGLSQTGSVAGTAGSQLTPAEIAALNATGGTTAAAGAGGGANGPATIHDFSQAYNGPLNEAAFKSPGILEGMSAEKALMTKMLLDSATGAGGQGGAGGSSTTTSSTPFTTNQNNPYGLQYNPNAVNTNTIGGMSPSSPYYGYAPLTFNYEPSIKPTALKAPELGYRARTYAQGGIADLGGYAAGGKLLKGPGDGMSDSIVANIGGKQPARLADGEFVIPADVVSHLGNGSTDAGAKQLYKMMDRIRHARTGNKKQGKQINPNKFLPKG
jgi:hypothetical protein